jgi:enoyl-CoA hydratase/carnithine racemase
MKADPMSEHLSVVDRGAVRVITLAQPSRRNALTPAMLGALTRALPTGPASPDQPLRVIILEGAGGVFSAGFDLDALDDAERARGIDPMTPAADAIAACPIPVIAAVDGHCHGGAVELCAACPIVVAAAGTRFSVPAVRLGLVYPASGLARFRRRLGAAAERVLLSGAVFSAEDARVWGLVHDVADDVHAAARQLADAIAAAAPIAVAGTLAALRAVDDGDTEAVAAARVRALHSDDFREGLLAWKQKRPPVFGGR